MKLFLTLRNQKFLIKSTIIALACLAILRIAEHVIPVQRGLRGDYYPNIEWRGTPAFSSIDSEINVDTAYIRRLVFPHEMYSIHWTGWLQINRPGNYTFSTWSDDGSSLHIDGKQIVDNGGFHAPQEVAGSIHLDAGFHQIDVSYFQGKARDDLKVFWQPPGQKKTILPSNALFLKKPFPGRLLLEQVILRGSFLLQLLTLLLAGLTGILHGKQIYQDLSQTITEKFRPPISIETAQKSCQKALVSRKFRTWVGCGLGGLFLAFLFLYNAQSGNGLTGSYYDNLNWSDPPVCSISDVSLNPETLYSKAQRPYEPNSLRWKGWIFIRQADEYNFVMRSDGFVFFTMNHVAIIEKNNNDHVQTLSPKIYLPEGLHQIEIKYRPATGTSHVLDVRWGKSGMSLKAIPAHLLFQEKPENTDVLSRTLLIWTYRSLRLLWLLLLATAGIGLLCYQQAVFVRLTQLPIFRHLWECMRKKAFMLYVFRQTWVHLVIIIALSVLLVFNNLGHGSIITTDFDEGMHTRVSQYMAKTGIWWSLYSAEGVSYYNKPPLKIWLNALTFTFLGDSEFFIRMWDAVFGLLTFIVLYFFGTFLFSSKVVGLLSVLILMGCNNFLFNHNIRTGVMDSLMIFFFVSTLFFFIFRKKRPYFYYVAGLCMGLGALTKSVQAFVPLLIIVLYLILTKQLAELKTRPFFVMVFLSLLLPTMWYIPQFFLSPGFFDVAIVQQIFHRVQGKIHQTHVHGPFFFFSVIYHGFFPWSLVALPAIGIGFWKAIRQNNTRIIFLLTWILTVFIGFSFSKMKVVWYMNPLYPALSLLIAAIFYSAIITLKRSRAYPLLSPIVLGLLILFLSSSLYANYQKAEDQPEKLPIHLFTEYLEDLQNEEYRVVLYNLPLKMLDHADLYYLERIEDRIIHADEIEDVKQLSHQERPLFVILRKLDYDPQPFFREHLYHYWLNPVYANQLYPKKVILVYNHVPENAWFIENKKRE